MRFTGVAGSCSGHFTTLDALLADNLPVPERMPESATISDGVTVGGKADIILECRRQGCILAGIAVGASQFPAIPNRKRFSRSPGGH